jgi:hypothetical protein
LVFGIFSKFCIFLNLKKKCLKKNQIKKLVRAWSTAHYVFFTFEFFMFFPALRVRNTIKDEIKPVQAIKILKNWKSWTSWKFWKEKIYFMGTSNENNWRSVFIKIFSCSKLKNCFLSSLSKLNFQTFKPFKHLFVWMVWNWCIDLIPNYDLKISFNLNDYFSFTTTTLDSVNVKISDNLNKNYFYEFSFKTLQIFIQIG